MACKTRCYFWFLLVDDDTGQPYMRATVSSVSLEPKNVIDELKTAVKENAEGLLKDVPSPVLDVYKDKAAFDERNAQRGKNEPLQPFLRLGTDPKETIHSMSSPCNFDFFNNMSKPVEKNGWIDFQTEIPPFALRMKRLYVRDSFKTIATEMLSGSRKKFIVSGTPGVGKSFFLIYLLWRLVQESKRVLFVNHYFQIYYDGQGRILMLPELPWKMDFDFWTRDLWCLMDIKNKGKQDFSNVPYDYCTCVLATKPRPDSINDFQVPHLPQWFFLPLWSQMELEMISSMYPKGTDWQNRFKILGGIPRWVLEQTNREPTDMLNRACQVYSLNDFMSNADPNFESAEKFDAFYLLVHITSNHPYKTSSFCFATPAVLECFTRLNAYNVKSKMSNLLTSCEGNPLLAALCRFAYARHAIKLLEIGGNFTCRRLAQGQKEPKANDEMLCIPPSTKQSFDQGMCLNNPTCFQLHVPKSKNCNGIDAWIPSIGGFHVTVTNTYKFKDAATNDFRVPERKLYWVLPQSIFATFTHKDLSNNMEQFALLIPYSVS